MSFLPVSIFCKSIGCPSSETLLAYRRSILRRVREDWVKTHLSTCDFCRAELQLLNRYPSVTERVTVGEVPAELRELAENVLAGIAANAKGCSLS
jgi:hypothetical protein